MDFEQVKNSLDLEDVFDDANQTFGLLDDFLCEVASKFSDIDSTVKYIEGEVDTVNEKIDELRSEMYSDIEEAKDRAVERAVDLFETDCEIPCDFKDVEKRVKKLEETMVKYERQLRLLKKNFSSRKENTEL